MTGITKTAVDSQKFDLMKVSDIEGIVFSGKEGEVEAQRSYMLALSYLETSKRFRETPVYSKTTFKDYLSARFGMKWSDYQTMKTIYILYPEEAQKHGVGLLIEAQKKVGKKRLPEAIQAINEAQKTKKKSLPIEKKREIVNKLAPEVDKSRTSWKLLYDETAYQKEELLKEVLERREAMQEMDFIIQTLKEEKLALETTNNQLEELVSSLQSEIKRLKNLSKPHRTPGVKRYKPEARMN